jgi:hypothetical protein
MKQFKSFNKSNIGSARKEIQKKLDELKALGLEIDLGNIRFSADSFNAKINVKVSGAECQYAKDFRNSFYFQKLGDVIGKQCKLGNDTFTFVGINRRARKNNALIENAQGKRFSCSLDFLKF